MPKIQTPKQVRSLNISEYDTQGAISIKVSSLDYGKRLDFFLSELLHGVNRGRINDAVKQHHILVDGHKKKPSYKIKPDELITGHIPALIQPSFEPENIPLNILYEDPYLLVINKQAGLVVHPAPGNWTGTLVNALLYHYPEIKSAGDEFRPGIVHRLDKETSGVMVIAKNHMVLSQLSEMFSNREVAKHYTALVHGYVRNKSCCVTLPVGRHPVDRKKMSTISPQGKYAETHFNVIQRFNDATLLNCDIKTGRTHQIRVHCLSMNHPLVGDAIYMLRKFKCNNGNSSQSKRLLKTANRQLLHSHRMSFVHPVSKQQLAIEAPIPEDLQNIIDGLSVVS